jgi:MFS family permease
LSVIPALLGLSISLRLVEPKVHKVLSGNVYAHLGESIKNFMRNRKLRMLSLSTSLGYTQGEAGWLFRSAFNATLWPVWAIGFAQALLNVSSATSFYFGGKVVKRFGAFKILITGKLYALLTNIIAVLMSNVISPVLLASNSIFFGAGNVSKSTLLQKEYTPSERATMDSLNSFFGSIAFAFISLGLGFAADYLNPAKALLYLQIIAVIALTILWNLYIKEYKKNEV